MKMSDEELKKELDKAAGNNLIEGHEITDEEKSLIYRIYQKYKGNYGEKAIDSLLYGVAVGIEEMNKQEQTTYGKRKK